MWVAYFIPRYVPYVQCSTRVPKLEKLEQGMAGQGILCSGGEDTRYATNDSSLRIRRCRTSIGRGCDKRLASILLDLYGALCLVATTFRRACSMHSQAPALALPLSAWWH